MKVFESSAGKSSAPATGWSSQARRMRQPISFSMGEHSDDPRWMLVQRIAASSNFRRSTLLANFLLFVCDRYLAGNPAEINEKQIGFHVFGRVEGYNASDDNIVRNYARTLRKRLEEYFATEGSDEALVLLIPRGGYVPVFEPRFEPGIAEAETPEQPHAHQVSTDGEAAPLPPSTHHQDLSTDIDVSQETDATAVEESILSEHATDLEETTQSRWFAKWSQKYVYVLAAVCTILVSAAAGYIGARGLPSWIHESSAARVNRIFWSRLFEEQRDTFVVPADGGLVMMQTFIREHVSLEDYANGRYREESDIANGIVGLIGGASPDDAARLVRKVEALGDRRYTSIADLELTTHLARLPEVVPARLMIRYARDLRIDDLRTGNVILIGSIEANPWVDLFQQQLNFRFSHGADFGGSGVITNQHPLPGEHTTYASEPNDPLLKTYGVIAYVPNLEGTGHVLLIEGVNMAGTQASGEFLLDQAQMQPVLEHAMGPHGVIRPFEVLIETANIAANASRPKVLSERIGVQ